MHTAIIFLIVLGANFVAAQLSVSGVYSILVEDLLLTSDGRMSPVTVSIGQPGFTTPAQAWAIDFTPSTGSASIQNIDIQTYIAPLDDMSLTLTRSAFLWQVVNVGADTTFCADGLCIDVPISGSASDDDGMSAYLTPQGFVSHPFLLREINPPPGWYQIEHSRSGTVFGARSVPSTATVESAPAFLRSQIWMFEPIPNVADKFSLQNAFSEGFLSLATSSGDVTAVGISYSPFSWQVEFIPGLGGGYIIFTNVGALTVVSNGSLGIADISDNVVWNFTPVDPSNFAL